MTSRDQQLAEIEAQEKELAERKAKLLAESKVEDLETVRRLCKLHGFNLTQLQGFLVRKSKNDGSVIGDESQPKVKRKYTKKAVVVEQQ